MNETWAEWFGGWCRRNCVGSGDQQAVKDSDFYLVARRMHGKASDRVLDMQLAGALRNANGAARAPQRRAPDSAAR